MVPGEALVKALQFPPASLLGLPKHFTGIKLWIWEKGRTVTKPVSHVCDSDVSQMEGFGGRELYPTVISVR